MKKQAVLLLLAGALLTCQTVPLYAAESEPTDKSESVFAMADAEGNPEKITVSEYLQTYGQTGKIKDYSNLSDIKNTDGDEEFTQDKKGNLVWKSNGQDITYEGTSKKELPVDVKVTYYLDGKKISPDDLAGKSGEVKICFDYENKEEETVKVDGEKYTVNIPFMVVSAVMLDDSFSNIEVSDGEVMKSSDGTIVAGLAFPGLKDSLALDSYEQTEDIDLADSIEITADVEDFSLDFTASIVTELDMSDLDLKDLDDVEDLVDGMDDLTDASSALIDGISQMVTGLNQFQGYMSEYTEAIDTLNKGAKKLTKGVSTLNSKTKDLEDATDSLSTALGSLNSAMSKITVPSSVPGAQEAVDALEKDAESLNTYLDQIEENLSDSGADLDKVSESVADAVANANADADEQALSQAKQQLQTVLDSLDSEAISDEARSALQNAITGIDVDVSGDFSGIDDAIGTAKADLESSGAEISENKDTLNNEINAVISDMKTQASTLQSAAKAVSSLSAGLTAIKSALSQTSGGAAKLASGMDSYSDAILQVYKGTKQLSEGTGQLSAYGSKLTTGVGQLATGENKLLEGMKTFDKEGIQEIAKLGDKDLLNVTNHIKAVKKAEKRCKSYGGALKEQKTSTKYIIETEEISIEE